MKAYDLIISALGEPTLNLKINQILQEESIKSPLLVCFNEPYGIGGHVMAVNLGSGGCLRCAYTDSLSGELTPFRASFVADGQNFKKSMSGCAGSYVEYSALDSQETAIHTVRLVADILKVECTQSVLVSWIGSSKNLVQSGFEASEYYESIYKKDFEGVRKQILQVHPKCPLCSNGGVNDASR